MSRFERRLGAKSSSPRPGQATCKIPKKNKVLSGFINIREKNVNTQMPLQNTSLQNIHSSNIQQNSVFIEEIREEQREDSNIKKIMNINEQLKKAMVNITDKNIKLIYGHEIRLNTLELNVDCLNDIKCTSILDEQEENEKQQININNRENIEELFNKFNNLQLKINENKENNKEKFKKKDNDIEAEREKINKLEITINNLQNKLLELDNNNMEFSRNIAEIKNKNFEKEEQTKIDKETEKQMQETEKQMQETEKQTRETEKQTRETEINELKNKNKKLFSILKKIANKMEDSKDIMKEINKLHKN